MKEIAGNGSAISISQAIAQMEVEQGENFSLDHINLAELERRTGISRGKLRQLKKNGFQEIASTRAGKKHAVKGRDVEKVKNLSSLSAIYSHRNLAFIGPAGTGKTHLAQAFGYACCLHGIKTYFIKATELRDKFTTARRTGKTDSCLNGLVKALLPYY